MKYNISLIIPAYNEEKNIEKVIISALKVLEEVTLKYEIIIINDGSKDKTGEIVEKWKNKNSCFQVIHISPNKGVGNALKVGFAEAKLDLLFWVPADGQVKVEDLPCFLSMLYDADIVAGFRNKRNDPLIRKFNAGLYRYILFVLFGLKIKDIDCNKLFRKEVFDKIKLKSEGQFVDAELLLKAKKINLKIREVVVNHYPRLYGRQTGGRLKNIFKAGFELLKLWKDLR